MTAVLFKPPGVPLGDSFKFVVPNFGKHCVCCGADAGGRTQSYDPSLNNLRAAAVAVPVCEACAPHALARARAANRVGAVLGLGVLMLGVGLFAGDRGEEVQLGLLGGGGALVAIALAWGFLQSAVEKSEKKPGHSPRLAFEVHPGMTVIFTDNEALVTELLELNPGAERRGPPPARESS